MHHGAGGGGAALSPPPCGQLHDGALPALLAGLARRATTPATARQLQAQLLLRGLPLPARAAVALIAASPSPRHARAVFDSAVPAASENVYLWTATIAAYARHASPSAAAEALELFRLMLRRGGPRPNAFTASSVVRCCSALHAVLEGLQVHGFLGKAGLGRHAHVGAALVDMYGSLGQVADARRVFDEIPARNVVVGNTMVACHVRARDVAAAREVFDGMAERDPISWNTLMSGYLRQGDARVARDLFEEMPEKNVNSWNMMISACSEEGLWVDAVRVFNRMRLAGFQPDAATMAVLMSACAQLGSLSVATQVHGVLKKGYVEMNCHVLNSLIDMYAKCGSVSQAHLLFVETHLKDAVSYNVMISALAHHGHGRDALQLFNEMAEEGLQPDSVTFLGVLSACAHAGLVHDGKCYFESMRTDYAIEQSLDHYACIVDLYGRAGLLEEAYCLVRTMPMKPHAGVWGALLNACRKHCHVEVGKVAARELIAIEPRNSRTYVLLANTLAHGQQWDFVETVWQSMRGKGIEKTAGCSWVEVDNVVHGFLMGEFSHPNSDEIYSILEHLYLQLT
ncbi:Pentatricopeptide repeat-containing protein [Dichanthelium oligosanthes]|uniref:Pentatricopeptide repeat-containing protein n=1 Tax=Dichanthelium oligosanthes TaxID=888268 RepID=A0A1E5VPR0_9POAL|nr:Pentatricopeptide repeat-containing protein [Dichanthelium oligosanthes]